jgi:hypothetical protein
MGAGAFQKDVGQGKAPAGFVVGIFYFCKGEDIWLVSLGDIMFDA